MEWVELSIIDIREEAQEYVSILFEKPHDFSFVLGECFLFRLPENGASKVFSFASSPTEDVIMISYKKGVSDFKKKLEQLQKGDCMEVGLYGSQFHFDSTKPAVFIAGGIGITAFRSILKYCVDMHIATSIHLIFINRTDQFPFQKELELFREALPQLSLTYLVTSREGRLDEKKIRSLIPRKNDEIYLAGPPLMIDDTCYLLTHFGVKESHLHTESFDGYTEEE